MPASEYRGARLGKNTACDLAVAPFAGVVYPASNQVNYYTDVTVGDEDLVAKIKARTAIITIQGCFARWRAVHKHWLVPTFLSLIRELTRVCDRVGA
jgi:hypothetical protein